MVKMVKSLILFDNVYSTKTTTISVSSTTTSVIKAELVVNTDADALSNLYESYNSSTYRVMNGFVDRYS